jgi:SAM-dependent methyltransferase
MACIFVGSMNLQRVLNLIFIIVSISCLNFDNVTAADTLTNQEIEWLYNKYIVVNNTQEYRNRYVPFPIEKNVPPWRWEGHDFPRVIALLEFERFVKENGLSSKNALAVNGSNDPEWFFLPHERITNWDYSEDCIKYDLHLVDLPEKDYDFAMVNQILEHVYDPIRCLKNLYRHMNPGGILYLNVPANNIPHSVPYHFYTGFTPMGLAAMVKLAGFEIMSIGQWGNLEYLNALLKSHDWPDYRYSNNPGVNELHNPAIVWVFALKPMNLSQ